MHINKFDNQTFMIFKILYFAEERRQLPSVSTALVLSIGIGIIEAAALYFGAGTFLNLMGISSVSHTGGVPKSYLLHS